MAQELTSEQVVALIRSHKRVVVFLHLPEDELCSRAHGGLLSHEDKMRALGYQVVTVEVGAKSSCYEDLACVRVPQLRFFANGRLVHKTVGPLDEASLDATLRAQ